MSLLGGDNTGNAIPNLLLVPTAHVDGAVRRVEHAGQLEAHARGRAGYDKDFACKVGEGGFGEGRGGGEELADFGHFFLFVFFSFFG